MGIVSSVFYQCGRRVPRRRCILSCSERSSWRNLYRTRKWATRNGNRSPCPHKRDRVLLWRPWCRFDRRQSRLLVNKLQIRFRHLLERDMKHPGLRSRKAVGLMCIDKRRPVAHTAGRHPRVHRPSRTLRGPDWGRTGTCLETWGLSAGPSSYSAALSGWLYRSLRRRSTATTFTQSLSSLAVWPQHYLPLASCTCSITILKDT